MKVRVYQPVGAPVRIVWPNMRQQEPEESENACLARLCAITEAADDTLKGLPFVDVDEAELPQERERAGDKDVRAAWRLQNGLVQIDETKVVTRVRR